MSHPLKNTEQIVTFTGCTSQGDGVGRLEDGLAVFVRGALAGETAKISLMKVTKHCAWGRLLEVLTPSPARIPPDCPYYPRCGGCQLRHMTYQEELRLKTEQVNDAFRRIGGLELTVSCIHGAAQRNGYRNKVQFPVSGGTDGKVRVGFYRQRSHDVIDVEHCLLQPELSNRAGRCIRDWMEKYAVPAYDERAHAGLVRHVFCRTNRAGELLICLVVNGTALPHTDELLRSLREAFPTLAGVVLNCNTQRTNVILGPGYRTLWGRDYLDDTLCGLTFRLSVPSFFQVNRAQAEVLYGRALEFAGLTGKETVLDLYCGTGTISLVMATRAGRVLGAEIVPQAIEDARENARRNGLEHTEFFCADAGEAARRLAERGLRPDVISVDPPRKGLSAEVIDAICRMSPRRVVYVSCDPATLARDLKLLDAGGYRATRAEAVDMFPGTGHVETVCLLSKLRTDHHIEVELSMDEMDLTAAEKKATYDEIKAYVLEHSGLKVSSLYIAQVKQKYGIIERENYNKPKAEDAKQPKCPLEKERAIVEALGHFGMI
ncbi:MAG: 23S rRNA (uracil(1939)-C(5))-methyltransferase RlmD [Clostridiales bacterium]|nr:23S rRNA (uracil(1939)-C(5))-methyltransferase RlmD [Clostridiales bacterium]